MKTTQNKFSAINALDFVLAMILAAVLCMSNSAYAEGSSSDYAKPQIPVPVQMGTILQVRDVKLEASTSSKAVGGVVGGALGALLSSKVSVNGNTNSYLVTSALASIGALGGALVAEKASTTRSQEIVYVLDDGKIFAVAQSSDDGLVFVPNQKIIILNGRIAPFMR